MLSPFVLATGVRPDTALGVQTASTAGDLARLVDALREDALCEHAATAFERDADLFAVPVVDAHQRPVGLINRFQFFERIASRFGRELEGHKPIDVVMDAEPLVFDVEASIDDVGTRLAQEHQPVLGGFIVTRHGYYAGLGTALDLIRALTDRRHAELHRLAHHDMLTGLPNRALFEQQLAEALAVSTPADLVAVLFVDLDRFKEINDSYGHRIGDLALCAVSQRMRAALRKSDLVARLSGDEFAAVLPGIRDPSDAETIAKVLLEMCGAPLAVGGREVAVSCSIGLAFYPADGATQEQLLRAADTAHYHAKELRNSWRRFSAEMKEWRSVMPGLSALKVALEHREVEVHYQPIVAAGSGRITSVEALVRWTHPEFGVLNPADIVRLADDSGAAAQLSEYLMRTAFRQLLQWDQDTGRTDLRMAINVSAVQIHEGGLLAMVDRLLRECGVSPVRLDLELTERAAMRASTSALNTLHSLKARGITLTLDDLGTGYSALSRLEKLPIDAVKIDRSFLDEVGRPGGGGGARAIIAMGRALGLLIVGEGVETHEQLDFLMHEGVDSLQGYLLARPMPGDVLAPLLTTRVATAVRFVP